MSSTLWRAMDLAYSREVALTVVIPPAPLPGNENPVADAMFTHTISLCRLRSVGIARIFDMVADGSLAAVVAEWIPSVSVDEALRGQVSSIGAARAVAGLAAVTRDAHDIGRALSLDDRARIRIAMDGTAYLAFPGSMPSATPAGDVRGLGSLLRALVAGGWPTQRIDGTGSQPRVPPETPSELREVISKALSPGTPINAGEIAAVLAAASVDSATVAATAAPPVPQPSQEHGRIEPRRLAILSAAAVATVAALGAIGWAIGTSVGRPADAPVEEVTTAASAPPETGPPPPLVPVLPVNATVVSPQQFPDNAATAGLAIDANPASVWSTDSYWQQFPVFKNGVGLSVRLPVDSALRAVWIQSPTPGGRVEIRTPIAPGGTLEDTVVLGDAVLAEGVTPIVLRDERPHSELTVWMPALAGTDGNYRTEIGEIGFLD
ncbi:hypothetical protein [Rhodococcus daqingensis]|uniref:Peptidoglycan lipid II flippase n=1 Tax=Rhodococcus daqingensis TaxID=2479363 RepID=A0ABW2RTM6_9NOCA